MTTFMFKIWIITLWLATSTPVHDPVDPDFYKRETVVICVKPGAYDALLNRNGNAVYVMDGQQNVFMFYDWLNEYKDGDLIELDQWDENNFEICATTYKGSLWHYNNNHHFTNIAYPEWFDGGYSEYWSK